MRAARRNTILILIFAGLFVALNRPLVSIANQASFSWGIPSLYLYIFVVWLISIVLIAVVTHTKKPKSDKPS